MTQDFHNDEEPAEEAEQQRADAASEWPAQDLVFAESPERSPFASDDSDAPVSLDEASTEGTPTQEVPTELASTEESSEPTSYETTFEAPVPMAEPATLGTLGEPALLDQLDEDDEPDEFDDSDERPAFAGNATEDGDRVDLHNAGARDIDATTVSITQGGARDVEATTVTITQGGAGRVRADEVTVSQGGIGMARTEKLTIEQGGTAFAVVAENAELDADTSVFLLVAGSTTGDVRPFLDWRAAAAFGAGLALVLTLLRRGRR